MRNRSCWLLAGVCWMTAVATTDAYEIPEGSPIAAALKKAEAHVARIVGVPENERNFANTVGAIDDLLATLRNETELTQFMAYVSTDEQERNRGKLAEEHVGAFYIELATREDLYRAIKAYSDTQPELVGEQQRLLDQTMRDYRRAGMELPEAERNRLTDIQKQLSKLQITFQANIRDDKTKIRLSAAQLRGMDEDFLAGLERDGESYLVGLDYPTYLPILEFCEVEQAREALWRARNKVGGKDNVRVLEEILRLRSRAARLLGYAHDVDFQTEIRMARNAKNVIDFYKELRPVVREKAAGEFAEFLTAKRAHTDNPKAVLRPWDQSFYESRLKRERYAVDSKQVQEYFPLDRVIDGLFSTTQSLYGIEYREVTTEAASRGLPVWHPDVRLYDVFDKQTSEKLGAFYLDLFPRDNKYNHAAQFGLRPRKHWASGEVQVPLVALVCNFTKPTADKPSLLTHDEVETFFHEFGHCLHSILTAVEHASFSGTAVARDFVEAPSQMFENWVWDQQVLNTFARHYERDEPLPVELLEGMIAARNFGRGLWAERQIFFGLLDLNYHLDPDGQVATTQVAQQVFDESLIYEPIDGVHPQSAFGHLMHYNSGYYGYMWSLVYAADMFQRFQELGMLSPEAGRYYRTHILAPGGTIDEMEMVEKYLGRKPDKKAFLAYLGLRASGS